MLAGTVSHGNSLGNQGTLGAGDVQWMTDPRYQDIAAEPRYFDTAPSSSTADLYRGTM